MNKRDKKNSIAIYFNLDNFTWENLNFDYLKYKHVKSIYIKFTYFKNLKQFLSSYLDKVIFLDKYEFTIELPFSVYESLRNDDFIFLKENKVNRLNLVFKNFNLKNYSQYLLVLKEMKLKLTSNINIDIYWKQKSHIDLVLFTLILKEIKHLTFYFLEKNVEKNWNKILNLLKENNFNEYLLSSFSRPKYESIQNIYYYNLHCWYGYGKGATSFFYQNGNYLYLKGKEKTLYKEENGDFCYLILIMVFSLQKGLNLNNKLHKLAYLKFYKEIQNLMNQEKLIKKNNSIFLKKFNLEQYNSLILNLN